MADIEIPRRQRQVPEMFLCARCKAVVSVLRYAQSGPCRSIFFVKASSSPASDLSPEGAWAEAVVQIIAAKRKENEQRAKRFMVAILAEREDGGKSPRAVDTPLRSGPNTVGRDVAITDGRLAFR